MLIRMTKETDFSLPWRKLPDLPDLEGFAGSYAGVHREALIVAGGANFPEKPLWEGGPKRWTDRIFVLTAPEGAWLEPARLPKPMGYGASVSLPDGALFIGGCHAEGALNDAYLLTWKNGSITCEPWPSLPVTLTGHAAVLMGNVAYVMGGSVSPGEQDAENRMWSLDTSRPETGWVEAPPLPGRGRFLHQMATDGAALYVLGGIGLKPGDDGRMRRDMLTEAWRFSERAGWERLADLPYPVAAAPTPAPCADGKIALLGGDDATVQGFTPQNHPGFHNQSLVYDIAENAWRSGGPVGAARAVLPCALWRETAVIVNGEQRPGKRSNQVWAAPLASFHNL